MAVTVWELFEVWGMLSSCICSTLVSLCAMKGIPIGPLAQWVNDLIYYLTPFFCLVNWDMHYPSSACRGTDLSSGRLLYIHTLLKLRNTYCPSVESQPSNPSARVRFAAGTLILTSILGRECVLCLCFVICCHWRKPWCCADHTFREACPYVSA